MTHTSGHSQISIRVLNPLIETDDIFPPLAIATSQFSFEGSSAIKKLHIACTCTKIATSRAWWDPLEVTVSVRKHIVQRDCGELLVAPDVLA